MVVVEMIQGTNNAQEKIEKIPGKKTKILRDQMGGKVVHPCIAVGLD